ncbi:MAG TPA: N(G),N(G)-dimethylarginine dimethylaminohydrolase [Clostridiales bacterium]|nr:N(G),N(G)-dimethylarginine dimethylaminohydrolase [Clostridiales bacterium]
MFKNVIVRRPSKSMVEGITSAPELGKPDYELALKQHDNYIKALESCGVKVTVLDAMEEFPDSCFVEDTAVLTKNCAIISNPGAPTRQKESGYMVDTIKKFYSEDKIEYITSPGTMEGGDVMMVGNHFYIGLSARTNEEGCKQFIAALEKHGHTGSIVPLKKVLHLKTGLAYLENNNLLVAGEFVDKEDFAKFNKIEISADEAYSANCIWVNEKVLVPAGYEKTKRAIENAGYEVILIDTSEYKKLDGGLSCLSLRF